MSDDSLMHIQELLESAQASLKTAGALLRELTGVTDSGSERLMQRASRVSSSPMTQASGRIIEGVFNGQNMIDSGGQTYPVPANYASKSKLVEGDGMKLTITDEGKFIYKQIAPVERKITKGVLIQEDGQYKVLCDGKGYRVLLASVTFYRAEVGDQVTVLLPQGMEAEWAAVDAVLPRHLAEAAAKDILGVSPTTNDDGEMSPTMGEKESFGDDGEEPVKKARKKKTL